MLHVVRGSGQAVSSVSPWWHLRGAALCSSHQAEPCNLSRQEGVDDEDNWLGAGVKVQLLKTEHRETERA